MCVGLFVFVFVWRPSPSLTQLGVSLSCLTCTDPNLHVTLQPVHTRTKHLAPLDLRVPRLKAVYLALQGAKAFSKGTEKNRTVSSVVR